MTTPADRSLDGLRGYLVVLDPTGSTASEVAARVFGQPLPAAIARVQGALRRLRDAGMAHSTRTPVRAVWHRTRAGDAWLAVADSGRVRLGAGMMRW